MIDALNEHEMVRSEWMKDLALAVRISRIEKNVDFKRALRSL